MKITSLVFLAAMLWATSVFAQELTITTNKKGKVGFVDQSGKTVVKCQYDSALPFTNGISIVTKSGKQGMIDESGRTLIKPTYKEIKPWGDNLYWLNNGKKQGLADRNGKIVLKLNYTHISTPNCYGKAWISSGGKAKKNFEKTYMKGAKLGIIDKTGKVLVTPKYAGLYEFSRERDKEPFHEGLWLEEKYMYIEDTLQTDCAYLGFSKKDKEVFKAGLMDDLGKEIIKPGTYTYIAKPVNDMARFFYHKKGTHYGYFNVRTGKQIEIGKSDFALSEISWFLHGDFHGDLALAKGNTWAFIDRNGKAVRSGYKEFKCDKSTGYWVGKNDKGIFEVYNRKCEPVPALDGAEDIAFPATKEDKEVFGVKRNGKYGIIDRSGKELLPFEYDFISANTLDFMIVAKNGECGIFHPIDGMVVPIRYTQIITPVERNTKHFWVRQSDSLYYHYNSETKEQGSKGYKYITTNFKDGIALALPAQFRMEDTPINRAQLYEPNTKEYIRAIDPAKDINVFGYIINTEDKELFDLPVSVLYTPLVLEEINKLGKKELTPSEKKSILLLVTRPNRSYNLNSVISESEWNY